MPSKPNTPPLAIGIDLGSQNARIALTKNNNEQSNNQASNNVQVVSNQQGQRNTLAYCHIVAYDANNNTTLYGMDCKKWCERQKMDLKNVTVRNAQCEGKARSAFFQHLCELARDASSSDASAVLFPVVSIPIYNHQAERNEEEEALKQSIFHGFCGSPSNCNTHFCLLTDPAAICIAHGLTETTNKQNNNNWNQCLVVDWGASGLKCSIGRNVAQSGMLEITKVATNENLNGTKMTFALMQHCAAMFERKTRCPGILDSKKAVSKLQTACESAFKTLSRASTATIMCDGVYEGMDLNVSISRPRLEMLCSSSVKEARAFITDFCNDVDVDVVLAAGNVCEMPAIKSLISSLFPNVKNRGNANIAVDEAVVIGCTMHASWIVQNGMHKVQNPKSCYAPSVSEDVTQLCPFDLSVAYDAGESSSSDTNYSLSSAVSLVEMGAPLPAHVFKTIDLSAATSTSACACSALMLRQINVAAGNVASNMASVDLARIGISEEQRSKGCVELSVTLTLDGKLTVGVDGGKEICISG
eukprot:CAMPEP_0196823764 /NCGR_PEP_ID=MMETSP1362-20130617/88864_1 /TAXON_ID=163516 /ORGANISM="Leptocylindrus danicus, Strain CCMP1856" /LENGTH=528 /DNA_ID=CAMNT_0042203745 /DNA_START=1 /DNA_END=1587 /DNA_ORIENTATION=+